PSAHFSRTLKLVRLIRTMFDKDEDEGPAIGQLDDGILKVYVAATGKSGADGTAKNPFATIEAARDAIRDVNKSDFDGIDVIVKKGTYSIKEAIVLTEEDSGTNDCPIRYIGEDGATIVGGVSFTAKDFAPATGKDAKYFPEADKVVQIDLGQFGYTPEDIKAYLSNRSYLRVVPFLSADAKRQTLCRYPNDEWINIDSATMIDYNGNETHYTDNDPVDVQYQPDVVVIDYGDEHIETVNGWTSEGHKYIAGHLRYLWCHDQTNILDIDKENGLVTVDYTGSYDPVPGMIIYFYNIPEELDVPGEYYISEDAILYYYPGENFETAVFSLPVVENILSIEGADYITLERLTFTSSENNGIVFEDADYLTIKDCTVSSIKKQAIRGEGLYLTIEGNHIFDIGDSGIVIDSGDLYIPEDYKNVTNVNNNYVHDWSMTAVISYAIDVSGIGITVAHNTLCDSGSKAINTNLAVNTLVEYNLVFNVLRTTEDSGALGGGGAWSSAHTTYRYNYIYNCGPTEILDSIKAKNPEYDVIGAAGFYFDGHGSFVDTYGNVIANIDGNGVLINGGRNNSVTGNLIVNCTQDYVWGCELSYGDKFDDDGKYIPDTLSIPAYVYLDEFKAVNPVSAEFILELDENTDPYDPMVKEAPALNVIKNNWCHFNKGNRNNPSRGTALYHIEEYFWRYTNEGDVDAKRGELYSDNKNHTVYNSKRDDVDIKKLITETAAGVIEIDWETFEKIGIDPTQWSLDVELPEKTIVFPKG
ncbi:MAG: right-handed parallel beta-helix repeat-containing protein, partial [Ruminococcaceae bacterium]|nr:right-handed parallel beta-helix repeat-containing protein [Oscillospiraceae bacterium]